MRFFTRYLRCYGGYILLYLSCILIFVGVSLLYRLPVEAIAYPTGLCVLLGTVVLFLHMRAVHRRHAMTSALTKLSGALFAELPESKSITEADLMEVIAVLRRAYADMQKNERETFREMTEYYTMWVHQIKTPIASMRLHLDAEDTQLSHTLKADLQRTEQYVEMVLGYLRTQSEESDYVISTCDIARMVRETAKRLSVQFIGRRISLILGDNMGSVLTDEKWFSFVLEQIFSNSLKYTQPGGTIEIGRESTDNGEFLFIRDNGIGIAPEDLPRIFDRGFTGYHGREDKRATGIGLYLCRRILCQLGHTVTAESAPGEGTTIRIGLSRKERVQE